MRTLAAFQSTRSQEVAYMRYCGSGSAVVADPSFLCSDAVSHGKQTLLGDHLLVGQCNSPEALDI